MSHPYIGQKKIKEIIYTIIEPTLEKQGWYLSKLILNWEVLIELKWKAHVWPVRFAPNIKDRTKGVLHVKVSHSGMQYVQFSKGFLIEKFNLYLGSDAITDIKPMLWHQTKPPIVRPATPSKTQAAPLIANSIQDSNLKEALNALSQLLLPASSNISNPQD